MTDLETATYDFFVDKIQLTEKLVPTNYYWQYGLLLSNLVIYSIIKFYTHTINKFSYQYNLDSASLFGNSFLERKFSTKTINDRQLLRQKIRQKISVIKTNSFDWELLTFDDIKKIVHFGILIHVLSWKQKCL